MICARVNLGIVLCGIGCAGSSKENAAGLSNQSGAPSHWQFRYNSTRLGAQRSDAATFYLDVTDGRATLVVHYRDVGIDRKTLRFDSTRVTSDRLELQSTGEIEVTATCEPVQASVHAAGSEMSLRCDRQDPVEWNGPSVLVDTWTCVPAYGKHEVLYSFYWGDRWVLGRPPGIESINGSCTPADTGEVYFGLRAFAPRRPSLTR
jgi:hypothetical protein